LELSSRACRGEEGDEAALKPGDPKLAGFTDSFGRHPLHLAVRNTGPRTMQVVRQLMEAYPKGGDNRDQVGRTALHCAAQANNGPAIEVMIDLGTDCNVPDIDGYTALQLAAKESNLKVAGALLKIDPEAKGRLKAMRKDDYGTKDVDFQSPETGMPHIVHIVHSVLVPFLYM